MSPHDAAPIDALLRRLGAGWIRRRRRTDALIRNLLGIPADKPRDGYQPYREAGRTWRGDQAYPLSTLGPDTDTWSYGRDGRYVVENLRWGFDRTPEGSWAPRWRRTRIDTNQVARAASLLYRFQPHEYAGHVALLLEFDGDDGLVDLESGASSRGLVLSAEAMLEDGQTYAYLSGLVGDVVPGMGTYPLVWVLSTYEDYCERVFGHCRRDELERMPLALSPWEVRALAAHGLETALSDHRDQVYHLSRSSCMTEHLDLLSAVVSSGRSVPREYLGGAVVDPRKAVPARLREILVAHGLSRGELERVRPVVDDAA